MPQQTVLINIILYQPIEQKSNEAQVTTSTLKLTTSCRTFSAADILDIGNIHNLQVRKFKVNGNKQV